MLVCVIVEAKLSKCSVSNKYTTFERQTPTGNNNDLNVYHFTVHNIYAFRYCISSDLYDS